MHLTGRALQSRVALKSAISETLLRFRPGARRVHPTDARSCGACFPRH
jgi:hypothetical protein